MMRRWCGAILIAMAARAAGAQESDPFASAVRALLVSRGETGDRPVEQAALARIYPPPDSRPLWSLPDGRPTRQAFAAIAALASTESHALVSEDYDVTALWELAFTAQVSRTDAARFDVALTRSMTRFLVDLRFGRIDPAVVRFDLPNVEQNPIEVAALVMAVARATDVPAAVAGDSAAHTSVAEQAKSKLVIGPCQRWCVFSCAPRPLSSPRSPRRSAKRT